MKLERITQRALEAYEEYLLGEQEHIKAASTYRRLVVEAAVKAGFATDTPTLADCEPWQVDQWAQEITAHITKSREIPGE